MPERYFHAALKRRDTRMCIRWLTDRYNEMKYVNICAPSVRYSRTSAMVLDLASRVRVRAAPN